MPTALCSSRWLLHWFSAGWTKTTVTACSLVYTVSSVSSWFNNQNAAVWLVFGVCRYDHITDALISLHWLPVPAGRILFKTAAQTPVNYRAFNGSAPKHFTASIYLCLSDYLTPDISVGFCLLHRFFFPKCTLTLYTAKRSPC